ncbi:MAG: hypothetical protein ACOC0N_06825 [Chroococcales cyanobacterium]
MSSTADKSLTPKKLLTPENIIYVGIGWGVVALLFFLLFSVNAPGEESPFWYLFGTYILECLPFLAAALLCFRNWRSPQIASGKMVWLLIGLGMTCYFLGGILFGLWELYFKIDPMVSPADFFYITFYILLGWGMLLAVLPRRLNLELWQWATIGVIALAGIALAVWITIIIPKQSVTSEVINSAPVAQQFESAPPAETSAPVIATSKASENNAVPGWVMKTDNFLNQFLRPVNFFYVVADVVLLIVASTLLLAFWGGKFAQSWRMIAAATLSLYVADMWYKYAATLPTEYESGGFLEVFFIFSGVLFTIGAALEYDISSSRSGRSRRRRGS